MEPLTLEYTIHAVHAMEERMIPRDWVERFYRRIPEHRDRVLPVAVNTRVAPWRVVSVFFDRRIRGEL